MQIIGVTGGFGTGKTTVAKIFKGLGAVVLDADEIAHRAISWHGQVHKKVLRIFGRSILKKNNDIDRKRLGKIVFKNKVLLRKLCNIIHPVVIRGIKEKIKQIQKERAKAVVVLDVPLLIEAGLLGILDRLIVVKANRSVQIKRCKKRTGLSKKEIVARIRAQMPMQEKIRFADFVIDNNGTRNQTKREVKKIWEQIQQQTIQRKRI
ncbi:MAG: dephospho-CoA kinase [Candidatus Omnitrophica bacterium]|nr:dephospho-CoA kinase [Candidatus Omnitrophota bacterium]